MIGELNGKRRMGKQTTSTNTLIRRAILLETVVLGGFLVTT